MRHTSSMLIWAANPEFNGNVPNTNLITNLPECLRRGTVLANRRGLNPIHVGELPPQLAALNAINVR